MLGGLLLLGYQIAPLFHLSAALHTHAQMRNKVAYTSAVRAPSVIFVIKRARGQSRTPSECRQFFETAQVKLVVLCMCQARPSAVRTRLCARLNGTRKVKYTRAFRLLLLIGNVLKTASKTKPASKLNCRVITFIYKLGYVKSAKRDIFLNSFELWMNMTKLHSKNMNLPENTFIFNVFVYVQHLVLK